VLLAWLKGLLLPLLLLQRQTAVSHFHLPVAVSEFHFQEGMP
jgi:hypothetical protein